MSPIGRAHREVRRRTRGDRHLSRRDVGFRTRRNAPARTNRGAFGQRYMSAESMAIICERYRTAEPHRFRSACKLLHVPLHALSTSYDGLILFYNNCRIKTFHDGVVQQSPLRLMLHLIPWPLSRRRNNCPRIGYRGQNDVKRLFPVVAVITPCATHQGRWVSQGFDSSTNRRRERRSSTTARYSRHSIVSIYVISEATPDSELGWN